MRAILQRVKRAQVEIDGKSVASVGSGYLILLGVCGEDTAHQAEVLAAKTAVLRVFEDENGKLNRSLLDVGGSALVVSNFTLYADCKKGRRPSFVQAGDPKHAEELYEYFCEQLVQQGIGDVQTGRFGADMQVTLTNDGPVTIILDTKELTA